MPDINFVTVQQLVDTLDIELLYGEEFADRRIYTSEVSRPGLILTGYIDEYTVDRVQLLGDTEWTFLSQREPEDLDEIYQRICHDDTPAILFARGHDAPEELIAIAKKHRIPILGSRSKTSRVLANVTNYLEGELAERQSRHGVFVEVFGLGVMIIGDSGVGKSETALELVQRGHRLIADDRVELFMIDELTLIGEAPEILEDLLEIRGLGIINIMTLYGVSAIRKSKQLEVIIELVHDDGNIEWDRLGQQHTYEQIFEVNVPKIRIPVKTGRNLSAIIETAALNFKSNLLGFNAKDTFYQKLDRLIMSNRQDGVD